MNARLDNLSEPDAHEVRRNSLLAAIAKAGLMPAIETARPREKNNMPGDHCTTGTDTNEHD
jgi:hypothetical protein